MTFATISAIADRIALHHSSFAEMSLDHMPELLNKFAAAFTKDTAMVGATWRAHTLPEYGDLNTLITINKLDNGWELVEQVER